MSCVALRLSDMTNAEWITLLQQSGPRAFTLLYQRYWKLMYKHALSRVEDDDVAQDIVQEVFISLWQKRERLIISTSMEALLLGFVKIQVLAYFKQEKVRQRVIDKAIQQLETVMDAEPISQTAVDEAIQHALADMPENMRQSFLLRCDNRSIREISEMLGIAEQTVSNNLNEVVRRLRKKMAQETPGEYLTCLSILFSLFHD